MPSAPELLGQCEQRDLKPKLILLPTGCAGTHAAMVAGPHAHVCDIAIMDISVRHPRDPQIETIYSLAVKTAAPLTDKPLSRDKVVDDDSYVGQVCGILTQGTLEATNLIA